MSGRNMSSRKKQGRLKRKKGFTLVELIVAIAIMGVLLIIALPQVSNIQKANKDRKFEAYKKSIVAGSKLYIDSYAKDLFGQNNSGCVRIKYSQLKQKNLLKDFAGKDIACSNDEETFVEVRKVLDEYRYKINITCKNTKTNKQLYKKEEATGGLEVCNIKPDLSSPTVSLVPTNSNNKWYNAKNLAVRINVLDNSGLNSNISIKYNWHNNTTGTTTATGSHNFKNKKGVEKVSYTIPISNRPKDAGGKYKIIVLPDDSKGNGIQDALGNEKQTSTKNEEYWIDNEKPKFNETKVSSSSGSFQSKNVVLNLATTDNFTGKTDLQIYISNTGYQKGGNWKKYSPTMNWTISGKYDGGNRNIYVSVKDLAGNIEQKIFPYKVYKECSSPIDNGTWYDNDSCSKKCGGGTKPQLKKQQDKYLGTTCPTLNRTVSCNTMECCSNIKYKDGKNCSAVCDGGTKNQEAYSEYDNSRCPTKDKSSGGAACNLQDCCSKIEYKDGESCSAVCDGGTKNQLAYSKYTGKRCSAKDKSSGGAACNKRGCCSAVKETSWSSWSECSASCDGGTKSRYMYLISKYTKEYCRTKYENKDCNTQPCLGTNNCKIRGSSMQYQNYTWRCDCGLYHSQGYTHYCTDGAGTLHTKKSNPDLVGFSWVCPLNPYGSKDGWSVITD